MGVNIESVSAKLSAHPFKPLKQKAVHWTAASGRFNFVLQVTSDGAHCVQMNTRDAFDELLAADVLGFSSQHDAEIIRTRTWCLLTGFHSDGYQFDSIIGVAPLAHQVHKADDPQLHSLTFQIYPAFRCEVAGNETVKEVVARHKMIDPANIHRDVKPYVRLRYANTRTRGRSIGDRRGIDTTGVLFGELRQLDNAPGSFVEFENCLGQVARAEWNETQGLVLEWKDKRKPMAEQALLDWARNFICPADQ